MYPGFPEYGLPSLDPLQVPDLAFNLRLARQTHNDLAFFFLHCAAPTCMRWTSPAATSTSSTLPTSPRTSLSLTLIDQSWRSGWISRRWGWERFNSVSIISQVDGELFIDGTILDIFPIYGDGPFWVEVSFTSVEPKFQSLFRFMVLPRVSSLTSISMAKDLCKWDSKYKSPLL